MWSTLLAETDRGELRHTGEPTGAARREEALVLAGAQWIHALTIEVQHPAAEPRQRPGCCGLGCSITAGWPIIWRNGPASTNAGKDTLQPEEFEPAFRSTHELMISHAELDAVRKQVAADPDIARELRAVASLAARVRPESLIGENVNFWNTNMLRRERDVGKMITQHGSNAAQAGLLLRDKSLCRLAARFALSLACCEHWEDVFFAHTAGSAWDQRGFIASIATWDCAMVLDLCGEWFTPVGREVILKRLAIDGQGAMNQAPWKWEYMFHTNQLAWISPARLYGLLVLEGVRCRRSPAPMSTPALGAWGPMLISPGPISRKTWAMPCWRTEAIWKDPCTSPGWRDRPSSRRTCTPARGAQPRGSGRASAFADAALRRDAALDR